MKTILLTLGVLSLGGALMACSSGDNGTSTDSGADQTTPTEGGGGKEAGGMEAGGNEAGGNEAGGNEAGGMEAGSTDGGNKEAGGGDGGDAGDGGSNLPAPPTLGKQIDRMGRAAANTALNHVFDPNPATQGPAKDSYNADNDAGSWPNTYTAEFAKNLAIYDGLDTICGNQAPSVYVPPDAGADAGASARVPYAVLANLLASDVLFVNTANTTCKQYLAVELNGINVPGVSMDCGGRAPSYNVIDFTYNAVAGTLNPAGLPNNPGPVTNGITAPASPPTTTFPYLAVPH